MNILKITTLSIAATAIIAFAPHAHANSYGTFGSYNGSHNGSTATNSSLNLIDGGFRNFDRNTYPLSVRKLGGSSTAKTKFARGLSQFEKGNLDESAYAFRSVLRANGSTEMDRMSLHYLMLISDKQGDAINTKKYAEAYSELVKK